MHSHSLNIGRRFLATSRTTFLTCALGIALLAPLLNGCSSGGTPPVSDRSGVELSTINSGRYRVVAGDTLYSIAWRHQQDFRDLAAANNIGAPFDIYPGQQLLVSRDAVRAAHSRGAGRTVPQPAVASPNQVPHPLASTRTKPQSGAVQSAPAGEPARAAKPATGQPRPSASRATPDMAAAVKPAAAVKQTGPVRLRWPGQGRRIRGFGQTAPGSPKPSSAISFLLAPGAPIKAAAAGQVVYVGAAVAGYQHFVIVKHNDTWLSAYGFNAGAAVREGQAVSPGETLATLSRLTDGTAGQHELHFEVRKDGVPVDPVGVIRG